MSTFGLPTHEVFVTYEDGRKESVAFQDGIDETEAADFRNKWTSPERGNVVLVTYEQDGKVLKTFEFYPF